MRTKTRDFRRPISWYIAWAIIGVIALAVLSGFVLSLPIWQIKQIEVTGNNYVAKEKILATARIPLGSNIFMIDTDEIINNFSGIVQIKEIKIRRKLPNVIFIDVKERAPFAIAIIGSQTALIDDDGYIIARQNLGSSVFRLVIAGLPVIRGISTRSVEDGRRLAAGDKEFIKDTILLLSKLIDPRTVQIDVGNKEDIVVFVEDMVKVRIGDSGDIERKIRALKALLDSAKNKWTKIAYIDVRVAEDPVIRFK